MWSLSFWETLSFWTMVLAFVTGVIAATAALVSRHAGSKASAIIQRESNEKIIAANERIANAEQRVAEANEKAEQERLARLRIEEKLAPRSLSQTQALVSKLTPFAGTTVFMGNGPDSGADARPLQRQLISVLKKANWKIQAAGLIKGASFVEGIGVAVAFGADKNAQDAANLLIKELADDGIVAAKLDASDNIAPHQITIIIGPKP